MSVWPSTRITQGMLAGNVAFDLFQRRGEIVELAIGARLQRGRARIEQHVGGEHEAVADDPEVLVGSPSVFLSSPKKFER